MILAPLEEGLENVQLGSVIVAHDLVEGAMLVSEPTACSIEALLGIEELTAIVSAVIDDPELILTVSVLALPAVAALCVGFPALAHHGLVLVS